MVSGKLIANGCQIKQGRTLGYAAAAVCNVTGEILAHGTSTLMILPGKGLTIDPPLPPKFIS
jgi:acyl-coenzyme A thioesterase PaaI-like protein